jgi:hypothetical protein
MAEIEDGTEVTVADLRGGFTSYAEVAFDEIPFWVLKTCSKTSETVFAHSNFIA